MDVSGTGKSPNTLLSFRYNANNEELEELYDVCEDDPPAPQCDVSPGARSDASPKKGDRTSSIIDKYFKTMRTEKLDETARTSESKESKESKPNDENRSPPKEVSLSPMKEYLNRLSKKNAAPSTDVIPEGKETKESSNETWKIFTDFKFKITQAVEDMKTRSLEESKEKVVQRESSVSDSEENSIIKDSDQSVGDTDNQVSSLESSMQNLSEPTQPVTAKATELESLIPESKKSDYSDDTPKSFAHSYKADVIRDIESQAMEVESGVEALEDGYGYDAFGEITKLDPHCPRFPDYPEEKSVEPTIQFPITSSNFGLPPKKNTNYQSFQGIKPYFLNYTMYFLTLILFLNHFLFPNSNVWNGFLLGIWFYCFAGNIKQLVLDKYFSDSEPSSRSFVHCRTASTPMYTIPSVKEHTPLKKYEGWINHYRYPEYDAFTYHINKTTTAFMKLEGCNLRISYTTMKVGKRALWDEKIEKVVFYQHRLYNLTGARVILLPKGLVRRRQWSKKYPICIILNEKEHFRVLEKENTPTDRKFSEAMYDKKREHFQENESTETNASPEKKKKFIWRRKDKSISHSEGEALKEGLRHRLVRKMHRDKKTDSVSTITEPPVPPDSQTEKSLTLDEDYSEYAAIRASVSSTKDDIDEELDETEISKIKEFLEEAELEAGTEGTNEGEWSLHVKTSGDKHSRLFLFARTGRDKHEWFRRLTAAVSEANVAVQVEQPSTTEDKTTSDATHENKEGIEMAVYKVSEKDTVAFGKGTKGVESVNDGMAVTTPLPFSQDADAYEKPFWPYLLKIIQSKSQPLNCECRMLPAEVTWVNTVMARVVYDVMRSEYLKSRLQMRIQRKLHTIKLPSFMSPLLVTDLSLAGACPLIERVSPPTWDERGVWLDADLQYDGGAYITILTQINLMKLKEKNITLEDQLKHETDLSGEDQRKTKDRHAPSDRKRHKPAVYDSEMEDSAESSDDDESPPLQPVDSEEHFEETTPLGADQPASSKKKLFRMVDKIASNKYFQQVTDYKYVKRAMEGLSNTDIKLQLDVKGLEGRIAFNMPPPPHDRIWIGFRTNPQLTLKARPAVGARALRFAHISNWIEQKLSKEFEKVLVMPNMEDFIVDLMTPTPVEFE